MTCTPRLCSGQFTREKQTKGHIAPGNSRASGSMTLPSAYISNFKYNLTLTLNRQSNESKDGNMLNTFA